MSVQLSHSRSRGTLAGRLGGAWPVLAAAAVAVTLVAAHLWWLSRFRASYPLDIDESRYLAFGLRLHDRLGEAGPGGFWDAWANQREFGPLLPLVAAPFFALFGRTVLAGLSSQLVFFALLVASSYGIGARLSSRRGGALTALLVATAPAVVDFTRSFQFAVTDAAVLAAATYALLASEAFSRRGWSLGWGVLLGLLPLSRTMAIAFIPAQLVAAVWLAAIRPGERRTRWLHLGAALLLACAVAATWLAENWSAVSSYLTNFGYGSASERFSQSGSRLSVGYWTREATAAIRDDLYLPLAALLALAFILAVAAWVVRRRGRARPPLPDLVRRYGATDTAVVAFTLLASYAAITSSKNEGVGFRVPLVALLVALGVAALCALPWRTVRIALAGCLVAVAALNLVSKAEVVGGLSEPARVSVPGVGDVPLVSGRGYVQRFLVESFQVKPPSGTQELPAATKRWRAAYAAMAGTAVDAARRGGYAPVVGLAVNEPLLNAGDLTLAARLHRHADIGITLLPAPAAPPSPAGYRSFLANAPGPPTMLITVDRAGFSYFALSGRGDARQELVRAASAGLGYRCRRAVGLPDGRVAYLAWREPGAGTCRAG